MEIKQYILKITKRLLKKSKNFQKKNDSENTATQNLWDAGKAVLRWKFIAILSYLKKQEKTSNRQSKFTPKTTEKRRTKKQTKVAEGKKL